MIELEQSQRLIGFILRLVPADVVEVVDNDVGPAGGADVKGDGFGQESGQDARVANPAEGPVEG